MKFTKQRLESLSDDVISIILTIMVFSIPIPHSLDLSKMIELFSSILVFLASFVIVAFQWHKHNFLFNQMEDEVDNRVIWHNFMFLFSISLIPVFTKLVMENPYNWIAISAYFASILLVNVFYMTLSNCVENLERNYRHIITRQPDLKSRKLQLGMLLIVVIVFVMLLIFKPHIASIILIVLPVWLSLQSIWSFGAKHKSKGPNE